MANLSEDLKKYSDELFTQGELKAGLAIIKEVAGAIAVGGFIFTALTVWMPAIGVSVATATVAQIIARTAVAYSELGTEDRKKVRAAVGWIKGGFSLGDRLIHQS